MASTGPIVIIINRFAFGGAEQMTVDAVNELHRRGVDVRVITLRPEREQTMRGDLRIPAEDIITIPFNNLLDVRAYRRLVHALRTIRPHAMFLHLWFSNSVGRIASIFARVPIVVTFEENVYDKVKTRRQFMLDRCLQYLSSRIIAVSDTVRDSLIAHGIASSRIDVVWNAIDTKRFSYSDADRTAHRAKLGLASHDFVYLFIGRLVRQKGVDILIEALSKTAAGKLVIVGHGPDQESLESLAHRVGVSNRVIFLGARRDLIQLFAASDCFVIPSRWEGFSIVLLQALAAGMPVIATDYNSVREVIDDGVSGVIVPLENSEALSRALSGMAKDPAQAARLRSGGRDAVRRFSIEAHVDTLLSYVS